MVRLSLSFLDRFRKKGEVVGAIFVKDLPEHHSLDVSLGFTRVRTRSSPFPADDPGAPFHTRDYVATVKKGSDPEIQPLSFETEQPVGYYYLVLRLMLAREIRGKVGVQIENFPLGGGAVEIRHDATVTINGSVTWPSVADEALHEYGTLEDLSRGAPG